MKILCSIPLLSELGVDVHCDQPLSTIADALRLPHGVTIESIEGPPVVHHHAVDSHCIVLDLRGAGVPDAEWGTAMVTRIDNGDPHGRLAYYFIADGGDMNVALYATACKDFDPGDPSLGRPDIEELPPAAGISDVVINVGWADCSVCGERFPYDAGSKMAPSTCRGCQ